MVRLKDGTAILLFSFAACSGNSGPPAAQGGSNGSGGSGGAGGNTPPGSGGAMVDAPAGGGPDVAVAVDVPAPVDTGAPENGTTVDAGDGPAATPDGTAASCPPGALVCEDFEKYATGAATTVLAPAWMTDTTGGTVTVDTSKPHAGSKSVHFTSTAGASNVLQIWKKGAPLFPVKDNVFYGRVMMWLSRQPTGGVHFNTVQANGLLPGSTQVAKYAYGAMYERLMAGYTIRDVETGPTTADCGKSPTNAPGYPLGKWVCAEWKFDGANDEMHYWFDGVAQTSVDVVKTDRSCVMPPPQYRWQAPVFDKVMLGWFSQVFPMPIDLWMDDIVIATERIGCPK